MATDLKKIWTSICQRVHANPRYEILSPWMDKIEIIDLKEDSVLIDLDDKKLRPFITNQHINLLNEIITPLRFDDIDCKDLSVRFIENEPHKVSKIKNNGSFSNYITLKNINSKYTFDNFQVGPSNRLAFAAAKAVSTSPGASYNPLFIHGGTGNGKTHLLQAICNELLKSDNNYRISYIPCETLLHDINSLTDSRMLSEFREIFYHTDVLIIENIHFLSNNSAGAYEFFHIFNILYNQNKQIIISSNKPPQNIENIPDNISSRFKWGLVVELENITKEMRLSIIRQKLENFNCEIPADVQNYIAENLTTNIRELEGALLKLIGYSSLLKQPLNLEVSAQVLQEYIPNSSNRNFTIDEIQRETCNKFNININDMLSKKRARSLVLPRHIAMYLVRKLTSASLEEIGENFGNRDHSTVKHAFEKIQDSLNKDSNLNSTVEEIKQKLLTSC